MIETVAIYIWLFQGMSIQSVEHVITREVSTEKTSKAGLIGLKREDLIKRYNGDADKAFQTRSLQTHCGDDPENPEASSCLDSLVDSDSAC
jgi:hypothetical protein